MRHIISLSDQHQCGIIVPWNKRHRRDSNPRRQSPVDIESTSDAVSTHLVGQVPALSAHQLMTFLLVTIHDCLLLEVLSDCFVGLVAMTPASHAGGRRFNPATKYFRHRKSSSLQTVTICHSANRCSETSPAEFVCYVVGDYQHGKFRRSILNDYYEVGA